MEQAEWKFFGKKRSMMELGNQIKTGYILDGAERSSRRIVRLNAYGRIQSEAGRVFTSGLVHVQVDVQRGCLRASSFLKSDDDGRYYVPIIANPELKRVFHAAYAIAYSSQPLENRPPRRTKPGHRGCSVRSCCSSAHSSG